jgi:enoyl-CoA hydratase/carnithine racemase
MSHTIALSPSSPLLEIEGAVATITLNRPAHRNRLEEEDLHVLLRHFEQINDTASVRVAVLTANTAGQSKPVFCAGYHMGNFDSPDSDPHFFEKIPDALAALRPVTVCALNGSVYGGATDLVLACDLRVALAGIEFRMPAVALGLHYYPSGLQRYVSRLGINAAKRAFLTGRPLTSEALDELGCLEALVDAGEFEDEVGSLVRHLAALAPMAAQATKLSLDEIARGQPDVAAMRAREKLTLASADFREGRLAFAEKRNPDFRGC